MAEAAPTQALTPTGDKFIEYQAFGSNEQVKLSMEIVRKWLVKPTKSGQTASDSDTMKFMMLCRARQLNPWEGDAFLVGYDGRFGPEFSLITAHQAFLKRAEAHPQYDGMPSGVICEKDGELKDLEGDFVPKGWKLVGGWAEVHRKDRSHPTRARLNVETFDKQRAQWNDNKSGMIVKCAEADALRRAFPNTLGGMYNDAEASLMQAGGNGGTANGGVPAAPAKPKITEEQRIALVDLAKKQGVAALGEIVGNFGFSMLADITVDRYDDVVQAIHAAGASEKTDKQPEASTQPASDDKDAIQGVVEPSPEPASAEELNNETESLRDHVKMLLETLAPNRQKDFLAGKTPVGKASHEELEKYRDELEGMAE